MFIVIDTGIIIWYYSKMIPEQKTQLKAYVPISTMGRIYAILADSKTGRVKYGAVSSLITKLLEEWIEETQGKCDVK